MGLVLLALLLLPTFALAEFIPEGEKVTWLDYRTPLTGVTVYYDEATVIWVSLPETFLQNRTKVELVWTIMSRVYDASDNRRRPSFTACTPRLRVGRGRASGLYEVEMDPRAGLITLHTNIQTRHLKPGLNKIKIMCHRPLMCLGARCQFIVTEMYFAEAVMEKTEAEEAGKGQDEKQTLAQQWIERCAFPLFLSMLDERVSAEVPPKARAEAERILSSKDWGPFKTSLSVCLIASCDSQVIRQALTESMSDSNCEKVNWDEPCLIRCHGFLTTYLENEMHLLRLELKKKFPDL